LSYFFFFAAFFLVPFFLAAFFFAILNHLLVGFIERRWLFASRRGRNLWALSAPGRHFRAHPSASEASLISSSSDRAMCVIENPRSRASDCRH
jgi:hypothetical protein